MVTKNSREQDKIAYKAMRDMSDSGENCGIEREENQACPADPSTRGAGSIGGGSKLEGVRVHKGPEKSHEEAEEGE